MVSAQLRSPRRFVLFLLASFHLTESGHGSSSKAPTHPDIGLAHANDSSCPLHPTLLLCFGSAESFFKKRRLTTSF